MGRKNPHTYTNTGQGSIHTFPWLASHFDSDDHYTQADMHLGFWSSHAKSFLRLHATAMVISALGTSVFGNLKLGVFIHVWPAQATTTAKRLQ